MDVSLFGFPDKTFISSLNFTRLGLPKIWSVLPETAIKRAAQKWWQYQQQLLNNKNYWQGPQTNHHSREKALCKKLQKQLTTSSSTVLLAQIGSFAFSASAQKYLEPEMDTVSWVSSQMSEGFHWRYWKAVLYTIRFRKRKEKQDLEM